MLLLIGAEIKTKMKILTSLLIVFLFIVGCKREKMWFNDTTVEGILLDSATLDPLKDIEVTLYRWKNKTGVIRGNYSKYIVIKTTDTDDTGGFKIKFNAVDSRTYYITTGIHYGYYELYLNNKIFDGKVDSLIKYGPYLYRVIR